MKKAIVLLGLFSLAVCGCHSLNTTDAKYETNADGFYPLFNGVDLEGWTGDKVGHRVEDGIIVADPLGNLYTAEEYSDFILQFEFKLTPGANNGIGIRVPRGGHASSQGMEIQILDDTAEQYANLAPHQYHGSVYGIIPAVQGHLKPVGEWNQQEIYIEGMHLRITLNGTVIVDTDLTPYREGAPTPDGKEHPGLQRDSGHISLAGHKTKLYFRNLRIKQLR